MPQEVVVSLLKLLNLEKNESNFVTLSLWLTHT